MSNYVFNPFTGALEPAPDQLDTSSILAYLNTRLGEIQGTTDPPPTRDQIDEISALAATVEADLATVSGAKDVNTTNIASLSGRFDTPISSLVQQFVNTLSGEAAGVVTASGFIQALLNTVTTKVDDFTPYLIDKAIACHGDLHVGHLTVGTDRAVTHTIGSSASGELLS